MPNRKLMQLLDFSHNKTKREIFYSTLTFARLRVQRQKLDYKTGLKNQRLQTQTVAQSEHKDTNKGGYLLS